MKYLPAVRSTKDSDTSLEVEVKMLQNQTLLKPQEGGGKQIPALNSGNERSTKVLVGIVVVFLVCHIGRLVIQVSFEIYSKYTIKLERHHFLSMYCQTFIND